MRKEELAVIMPVYNEEGVITDIVTKWLKELDKCGIEYRLHVYNDGSKDKTLEFLNSLVLSNKQLIVYDKKNSGHGPTILGAYRQNIDKDWIFQTDSDNEISPEYFLSLWEKRNDYDFLIGKRQDRCQPISRRIISFISRIAVRIFYGRGIWDVNSPYRLMRTSKLKDTILNIPENTFAPNVVISGVACLKKLKILEVPVAHQNRQTGQVSIRKLKLFKAALKSFFQVIIFRFSRASKGALCANT